MLFHRLFERQAREHLPAVLVADPKSGYKTEADAEHDVGLIDYASFQGLIGQAHATCKAAGHDLPAHAFANAEGVGKLFDGHLIAEFKAWLQTPAGQFFLQVMKALAIGFLMALLGGT